MYNIFKILFVIFLLFYFINDSLCQFKLGDEVLISEKSELIKNKRLALITNKTGVVSNGNYFFSELLNNGFNVVKIFTPEHGFSADDKYIENLNIPVISLYNSEKSFSKNDIEDVDVLIFDIQDLGARYYTYTSTLYLAMKDAVKYQKEFIICDRPCIGSANSAEGFMLEEKFSSFVGMIPTTVTYGLTIGELGKYLKDIISPGYDDFYVIPMKNYTSKTNYEDLNLKWVNPSPNITSLESARIYPALCFLEGTNFSEGRGTDTPFQLFGAPYCDNSALLDKLNAYNFPGVKFERVVFTPSSRISAYEPKFMNRECNGIKITVTDYFYFKPVEVSVAILIALKNSCNEFKWINKNYIDKLAGTDKLRKMIDSGKKFEEIINSWRDEVEEYKNQIKKYLIYD
jgi:uncharacterized protein YbbC (DUF1343 family)